MKYSRYQRGLHVEKIATILRDDPSLSARAVFRILNEQGDHLSRSYVNQIVADALLRIGDEERRKRIGAFKIGDWLQKMMELSADLETIKQRLDALIWSYPDDIEPRY
jgi:hypothetical protein